MGEFVSVIFCRNCGSRFVEISRWNNEGKGKAIIHCRTCDNVEEMGNFSLGRCQVTKNELNNARLTVAKKGRYEK